MSAPTVFINRKSELKYLIEDINKDRVLSKFLLITSTTGIGKTELVNKAFSEYLNGEFRVNIPIDTSAELNEGYFFKEITKIVHKNAKIYKEYQTITSFINTHHFYKGLTKGASKTILKYIGVKYFEEGYKKGINQAIVKDWISDDKELLQICLNYLLSILKKQRLLIAIENVQKIDTKSLNLIKELLITSDNAYFVGEYTIKKDHSESDNFIEIISNEKIELSRLTIEKIPKKELVETIINEKDLIISILQDTYDKSDGNLHKFKLLKRASNATNFNVSLQNYDTITTSILNSLGFESTLLFAQIECHSNSIELDKFKKFQSFITSENQSEHRKNESIINNLVNIGLIEMDSEKISVHHDSISIDFKNISQFQKVYPIVTRDWIRFYEFLERQSIINEEDFVDNLLWQIHFLLKIKSFDEITIVLKKLSKCIAEGPYNKIINYIDLIAKAIRSRDYSSRNVNDNDIIKWVVIMYYQCGFSKKVTDFVQLSDFDDPIIYLCYLASCSTMSHKHEYVLENIENIINQSQTNLKLGLILVKIRTLRSSYKLDESKWLWLKHYDNDTFKNTSYYAGFLKYASLVFHDDIDFRIKCLKKSSKLYKEKLDYYGMISTYNTLGRDFTYNGNLKLAKLYLNKAEILSSQTIYPMYQLYNNISALEIVNRNISQRTIDRLNNALNICTNGGDQLIMLSNLLCIYILKNDEFYGYRLYRNLKQKVIKTFNKDSLIGQICLYNCWKYAISINKIDDANDILENYLKQMKFYRHPELWETLISNDNKINHPVITNQIYPHFIIDWEVDYYNALSNY